VPVPIQITAIVVVAILIPSVLITALGLFAVYRAEPMVREQLGYPIREKLDLLRDRLSGEWKHRLDELARRVAVAGRVPRSPPDGSPFVLGELLYHDGEFQGPTGERPPVMLEAPSSDPQLARARELEFQKKDFRSALSKYREIIAEGTPEARVEALLGAARCHRELREWREAVQALRQVVDRFGETADLTGVERTLPALLSIAEVCRESGDQPGEQLAVRELLSEIKVRRRDLNADQEAFYAARLKRYPEAESIFRDAAGRSGSGGGQTSSPPDPPSAPGAGSPGSLAGAAREEVLDRLRAFAAESGSASAPGYHRVKLSSGASQVFAFFPASSGGLWFLRLDPQEYLRDVRYFSREVNLSERALRFTDHSGRAAGVPAGPGFEPTGVRPLASLTLPGPLSHLSVHYHPAPGEVTEELERLETSRVALFTWSIIVLVLMIILGVSLTLRSVLREMRVTKLKSDFVGFVTHELKTPLTAIRMFVETLLLDRVANEEERRRSLELIDQEAMRLTRLIEQILEFSKIERRQKTFQFLSEDMSQVVDEAVGIFLEHNRESGCEIEVNKAQDHISRIKMDRAAMVELILNLLSNALKYSRDSRKIVLNVRESINDITVEVVDRGIGIPKREQKKIFEQFYRAEDYLTREIEGTGLGLTFARYIAKVHGGDIKVSSAVNQGSTFTLELRKNQILAE
jgi:signal transduction histidine kinase